jgi:hypothetical protein
MTSKQTLGERPSRINVLWSRRGAASAAAAVALASMALLGPACFSSSSLPRLPPLADDAAQGSDTTIPIDAPAESTIVAATDASDGPVDSTVDAIADAAPDAPDAVPDAMDDGATAEGAADASPDTSAADAACPTTEAGVPETNCSGVCVDTSSDPLNCGSCANACPFVSPSVAMCNIGRCLIALSEPPMNGDWASYIAFDSTTVYFSTTTEENPGTIQEVPIGGGVTTTVVSNVGDTVGGLAVGNGTVYWTAHYESRIVATPVDGGPGSTLAYGQACSSYPSTWNCAGRVALQAGQLYWAVTGPYTGSSPDIPGQILTMPTSGTAATVLGADNSSAGFQMGRVVATGTGVVWVNPVEDTIDAVPLDGGAVSTIVSGPPPSPEDVAADTTNIYYVDGTNVAKVPRIGGPAVTLASGQSGAHYVAVDSTSVYWATTFSSNNAVMKVPIAGGNVTTLAAGLQNLWDIVADGTNVYVSEYASGDQPAVLQLPAN